jgi:hypothetical protein
MNTMRRVFYLSRAVKPMANAEIQAILRRDCRSDDLARPCRPSEHAGAR